MVGCEGRRSPTNDGAAMPPLNSVVFEAFQAFLEFLAALCRDFCDFCPTESGGVAVERAAAATAVSAVRSSGVPGDEPLEFWFWAFDEFDEWGPPGAGGAGVLPKKMRQSPNRRE